MGANWLSGLRRALGADRGRRGAPHRARPQVEGLEDRWVPANFVVTSLSDVVNAGDGVLTLREAVAAANADTVADTITFAPGLTGTVLLTGGQMVISNPVTITGNGAAATVINAQQDSRIFDVPSGAFDVTLAGLTLRNGRTTSDNANGRGGAVRFNSSGVLTVRQSTLSGNSTQGAGAGGGAIYAFSGAVTVSQSTLSGNSTAGTNAYGGAIYAFSGGATVSQSTVSGNSTAGANAYGGAIFAFSGAVTVSQSTVTLNRAAQSSGGGVFSNSSAVTVTNSIVAGNTDAGTAPDLRPSSSDPLDVRFSLIGNSTGTTLINGTNGNRVGTGAAPLNALLGPLGNNGGPTRTHALLAGSPARDTGSNALAVDPTNGNAALTTDQRGGPFVRRSGTVDMGAVEAQAVAGLSLVVGTLADESDGMYGSDLSLREAVGLANGSEGANAITFAPGLTGTIALTLRQMEVTGALTITGNGSAATVIDARQASRIFDVLGGSFDVTLAGLTLRNGLTTADNAAGGAVRFGSSGVLTVRESTLSGNSTEGTNAFGGAIYAQSGAVTVRESTLSSNSTAGTGAAGGAIYAQSGAVTVRESTLSSNSTRGTNADGGAIYARSGAVTVSQSTLSGNSTEGTNADGGAIFASSGAVTVSQSTLSGNRATQSRGGGVFSGSSPVTITNSIVAGNTDAGTAPDLRPSSSDPLDVRFSLIGNNTGTGLAVSNSSGNRVGTGAAPLDPLLGPLGNNGGPTRTHALLAGSPARDTGGNLFAVDPTNGNADLTTDQRGSPFVRRSGTVDMGAFEAQVLPGLSLVVGTLTDERDGDFSPADLSLREAVGLANGSEGANAITFAPGLTGTIALALGQMEVTGALTITGNGAASTIIDAQRNSRIFDVLGGSFDVTLAGLTLRNGLTTVSFSDGRGGAVRFLSSGVLTVRQSTLSGNSTEGNVTGGGAIYADTGAVTVVQSTLSSNSATNTNANGGAIYARSGAVTVSQSTLSGNSATGTSGLGGAIFAGSGVLTVRESTLSGNSTSGAVADGGAIYVRSGTATVSQSTLSGNSTQGRSARGGAIFASGALTVRQSTLSGNSTAGTDATGGAIFAFSGAVTVSQSTLTGNRSTQSSGGGVFSYSSALTITNSIVAGNTDNGTAPDLRPSTDTVNDPLVVWFSLIGNNTGTTLTNGTNGNRVATGANPVNALLGALGDNGGPTRTHALLAGSPARDAGSNALAVDPNNGNAAFTTDQRGPGFTRFFGTVDMGAFEVQPPPPPPPSVNATPPPPAAPRMAVGSDPGGQVKVLDLLTRATLTTFTPYVGFAGPITVTMGDVTGDGIADIVTGTGPGNPPHVKVFDGTTFAEVASFFAFDRGFVSGVFVAVGNVNGDSFADIIVGAGPGAGPHVKVFDGTKLNQVGADGQPTGAATLASFFAFDLTYLGGLTVGAGDLTGDGRDEVLVGSASIVGHVKAFNATGLGNVQPNGVINTSSEVRSFLPYPGFLGGIFVAAGDLDGDGRADLITGANNGPGHVKVFRGTDNAEVRSFFALPGRTGGVRVATARLDAANAVDTLFLAPGAGTGADGRVLTDLLGSPGDPLVSGFPGGIYVGAARR